MNASGGRSPSQMCRVPDIQQWLTTSSICKANICHRMCLNSDEMMMFFDDNVRDTQKGFHRYSNNYY